MKSLRSIPQSCHDSNHSVVRFYRVTVAPVRHLTQKVSFHVLLMCSFSRLRKVSCGCPILDFSPSHKFSYASQLLGVCGVRCASSLLSWEIEMAETHCWVGQPETQGMVSLSLVCSNCRHSDRGIIHLHNTCSVQCLQFPVTLHLQKVLFLLFDDGTATLVLSNSSLEPHNAMSAEYKPRFSGGHNPGLSRLNWQIYFLGIPLSGVSFVGTNLKAHHEKERLADNSARQSVGRVKNVLRNRSLTGASLATPTSFTFPEESRRWPFPPRKIPWAVSVVSLVSTTSGGALYSDPAVK